MVMASHGFLRKPDEKMRQIRIIAERETMHAAAPTLRRLGFAHARGAWALGRLPEPAMVSVWWR